MLPSRERSDVLSLLGRVESCEKMPCGERSSNRLEEIEGCRLSIGIRRMESFPIHLINNHPFSELFDEIIWQVINNTFNMKS